MICTSWQITTNLPIAFIFYVKNDTCYYSKVKLIFYQKLCLCCFLQEKIGGELLLVRNCVLRFQIAFFKIMRP